MSAEVCYLISGGLEISSQLHFQLKPAMIRSNANTHHPSPVSVLSKFMVSIL
jgi:hypothetical protein